MSLSNVLIIGSGGREHALAWALSKSSQVGLIYCAPGNGGMASIGTLIDIKPSEQDKILSFIEQNKIDLTVIGPEAPLVEGLADFLRSKNHLVVGAGKEAAQLEGSKIFAKKFMKKYGVPTADYREFTNSSEAKKFAASKDGKNYLILKADGLAAGKGVFVCKNTEELNQAIETVLDQKKFGDAGSKIILEEKMEGPEVSVIALTDGKTVLPFPAAQDHKRAFDDDQGPNTGGMGAYAPTPFYDDGIRVTVNKTIIENFSRGIQDEGLDFRGFIYFGLMLTSDGPRVLEFNVRFGDPEAQVVLPLIESDLFEAFVAVAKGELSKVNLSRKRSTACTVVMASGGYPGGYEKGFEIKGLDKADKEGKTKVFHAGTKKEGDKILTNGGRVLNVTGVGNNLDVAVVRAYQGIKHIRFKGGFYRNDIGTRALKNKNITTRIKRMNKRHAEEFTLI